MISGDQAQIITPDDLLALRCRARGQGMAAGITEFLPNPCRPDGFADSVLPLQRSLMETFLRSMGT